jgi:hypothetical protein
VEHVVFFPAPDGSPAFRRVPTLEEAVRLVEHLRNAEGVASVSVHALTEVPLAFRAYYRVEVPAEAAVPVQPSGGLSAAPDVAGEAAPVAVPVAAADEAAPQLEPEHAGPALALVEDAPADEPVLVSSNGHGPATPASLGFFA